MATLTQVAGQIYDQGVHDPGALALALAKATKVSALAARSAATGVVTAKQKAAAAGTAGSSTPRTSPAATSTTAGGASTGAVVQDVALGGLGDAATATRNLLEWISDQGTWVRIGYVVLGGALVVVGTKILVEGTAVSAIGGTVAKTLKSVKG